MASGTITLSSSKAWKGEIRWSSEVDIANNCSELYVYAAMWKTDGYLSSSNSSTSGTIKIDGTSYSLIKYQEFKDEVCIFEDTIRVYHNNDGSKSISISLTCNGQPGTNLEGYTLTGSGTITLDQIARVSSIGATDAAIESTSSITIYRQASTLSHRIKVQFGSLVGYVTASGGFSTSVSTIGTSYTSIAFKIPTDFYDQIPNATGGTCTLTLYTLSGSTVLDGTSTTTIQISTVADRCKPTISANVTQGSDTSTLTGDASKFIRHYSTANCSVSAAGRYGATITETWMDGTYTKNADGTFTVDPVSTDKLTFYAKDSRGYTNSVVVNLTLVAYIALTNNATVGRPNPVDGSAFINFSGDYFNDSFGAVDNALSAAYRITQPDGTVGDWVDVSPTLYTSSYSTYISFSEGFVYTQSYTVDVRVWDKIKDITRTLIIKQGIPIFDWGKNDVAFHVLMSLDGNRIANLGTPKDDTDAVNKAYLDNIIEPIQDTLDKDISGLKTDINNKITMTLLWTNGSPSSTFASQTISLDLSSYTHIGVIFKQSNSVNYYLPLAIYQKGLSGTFTAHSNGTLTRRSVTSINNTGVTFNGGLYYDENMDAEQDSNGSVIPYKIYGIKGVK